MVVKALTTTLYSLFNPAWLRRQCCGIIPNSLLCKTYKHGMGRGHCRSTFKPPTEVLRESNRQRLGKTPINMCVTHQHVGNGTQQLCSQLAKAPQHTQFTLLYGLYAMLLPKVCVTLHADAVVLHVHGSDCRTQTCFVNAHVGSGITLGLGSVEKSK